VSRLFPIGMSVINQFSISKSWLNKIHATSDGFSEVEATEIVILK
jgi:hypothetical protein